MVIRALQQLAALEASRWHKRQDLCQVFIASRYICGATEYVLKDAEGFLYYTGREEEYEEADRYIYDLAERRTNICNALCDNPVEISLPRKMWDSIKQPNDWL